MKPFFAFIISVIVTSSNAQPVDSLVAGNHPIEKQRVNFRENQKLTARSLLVPLSLVTYGFISLKIHTLKNLDLSTKEEIREDHPQFATKLDNYLQYSPAFAVYSLNALGIKGKNNLRDRTMLYALTTLITTGIVSPLKRITAVQRPDQSSFTSFPSGHTATAFAAAEFLNQEYGHISPWYSIGGYTIASATGLIRMYNNKHWLSDIVEGAGIGILSTKIAYWTYPALKRILFKKKITKVVALPFHQKKCTGIALAYAF
jgi:hypothetical protein